LHNNEVVFSSAEGDPFSAEEMAELTRLAKIGVAEICKAQAAALGL
jgi:ribonuclease PH